MSERGRDLYGLLGVAPDADAGEVARAYRRRLREVHPDTRDRLTDGPESAQADLRALQEAYSVLRDPARRAGYDVQRRAALTRADAPATGVAVPVRAERRIPLWDAQDHGSAHASPLAALRPLGLEMFSAWRLALPRAALVPTLVVSGRPGVGPTR